MFESFIVTEPNPYLLEIKRTKFTRSLLVIFVIMLLIFIVMIAIIEKLRWAEVTALINVISALKVEKLYDLSPRGQTILYTLSSFLALLPVLFLAIKYLFSEQTFSFDSNKREITKNGRIIAKFDDINILRIDTMRTVQGPTTHKLLLYFKRKRGLFNNRINLGLSIKWNEASKIAIKLADIIGVDANSKVGFNEKVFYEKKCR